MTVIVKDEDGQILLFCKGADRLASQLNRFSHFDFLVEALCNVSLFNTSSQINSLMIQWLSFCYLKDKQIQFVKLVASHDFVSSSSSLQHHL